MQSRKIRFESQYNIFIKGRKNSIFKTKGKESKNIKEEASSHRGTDQNRPQITQCIDTMTAKERTRNREGGGDRAPSRRGHIKERFRRADLATGDDLGGKRRGVASIGRQRRGIWRSAEEEDESEGGGKHRRKRRDRSPHNK